MLRLPEGLGAGGADKSNVDRRRFVEQPLFAFDFNEPDDVVLGHVVDLAAAKARINVGVQADLGETGPIEPDAHER